MRSADEGNGRARISLRRGKPINYCRPSVDHLLNPAARVYVAGTLAVVMTGMGADGLAGACNVHEAEGRC